MESDKNHLSLRIQLSNTVMKFQKRENFKRRIREIQKRYG